MKIGLYWRMDEGNNGDMWVDVDGQDMEIRKRNSGKNLTYAAFNEILNFTICFYSTNI